MIKMSIHSSSMASLGSNNDGDNDNGLYYSFLPNASQKQTLG